MIEHTIKDSAGFRLTLRKWKCQSPQDMNALEFVQQSKNKDGEVDMTSTYQFFMTDAEIKNLCEGLSK